MQLQCVRIGEPGRAGEPGDGFSCRAEGAHAVLALDGHVQGQFPDSHVRGVEARGGVRRGLRVVGVELAGARNRPASRVDMSRRSRGRDRSPPGPCLRSRIAGIARRLRRMAAPVVRTSAALCHSAGMGGRWRHRRPASLARGRRRSRDPGRLPQASQVNAVGDERGAAGAEHLEQRVAENGGADLGAAPQHVHEIVNPVFHRRQQPASCREPRRCLAGGSLVPPSSWAGAARGLARSGEATRGRACDHRWSSTSGKAR